MRCLSDRSKTVRYLIEYAMEKADQESAIIGEARCTNCLFEQIRHPSVVQAVSAISGEPNLTLD